MAKTIRAQGELEHQVLQALWAAKSSDSWLTSQQVLDAVSPNGELALTTILTVLARLQDKELVLRKQGEGRSLLFSAAATAEQHASEAMLRIVQEAANPALALSHFVSSLDPASLRHLRDQLAE